MNLAIIQARYTSTRLPGKVLADILGKPMFIRQVERVKRANTLDKIVVATSVNPSDDQIVNECKKYQVDYFRGSLEDVLSRFYECAALYKPSHIIRLTADCPLIDEELIDQIVTYHELNEFDYTSNTLVPTYPDGLDVEVFTFSALSTAHFEASLPSHREHVTPFIHSQPNRFHLGSFEGAKDLSNYRWTVDQIEDLKLVVKIYEALHPINEKFTTADILRFLGDHPDLLEYNNQYTRNEGHAKSLEQDKDSEN